MEPSAAASGSPRPRKSLSALTQTAPARGLKAAIAGVMTAPATKPATASDQDKAKKSLLNFRSSDGLFGVTRNTMRKLAAELNLNESQVVHVALRRLADSVLPAYEADDGPLSAAQLATIRRLAGPQEVRSISSTLL